MALGYVRGEHQGSVFTLVDERDRGDMQIHRLAVEPQMNLLHGRHVLPLLVQQPQALPGAFPEVRVHAIQLRLADQLRGGIRAIEPDGGGVDVNQKALRLDEDRLRGRVHHVVETLLTLAQRRLRPLALRDVDHDRAEPPAAGRKGRDAEAFLHRRDVGFETEGLARLRHPGILGQIGRRLRAV